MTELVNIDCSALNQTLDVFPDAALSCDEAGRILTCNREATHLLCMRSASSDACLGSFLPTVAEWLESSSFLDVVRSGGLDAEHQLVDSTGVERQVWLRSRLLARTEEGKRLVLITLRDVTSRAANEHRLRQMAVTDDLTGLHNRRYLDSVIALDAERSLRYGYLLSCAFIDLDRFKRINDEFGHHVGDKALVHVASLLKSGCRKIDTLVRWGGDEFVVVSLVRELSGVRILLERLVNAVRSRPLALGDMELRIELSCGASVGVPGPSGSASDLLEHADRLLRRGKEMGRGGPVIVEMLQGP